MEAKENKIEESFQREVELLHKVKKEIKTEKKVTFILISILIVMSILGIIAGILAKSSSAALWVIIFVNALTLKATQERVFLWKNKATETQIHFLTFMNEVRYMTQILAAKEGVITK